MMHGQRNNMYASLNASINGSSIGGDASVYVNAISMKRAVTSNLFAGICIGCEGDETLASKEWPINHQAAIMPISHYLHRRSDNQLYWRFHS